MMLIIAVILLQIVLWFAFLFENGFSNKFKAVLWFFACLIPVLPFFIVACMKISEIKFMGYYINVTSTGKELGREKVEELIDDGAIIVSGNEFVPNLICVVDNGLFEAAGFAYSEREYLAFKKPDERKKTWLVHPKAAVLAGYNGE